MTQRCLHSGARVFTQPPPTKESEVFENIFEYIDRIFGMIRPRKVLFMAIGALSSFFRFLICSGGLAKEGNNVAAVCETLVLMASSVACRCTAECRWKDRSQTAVRLAQK
jgi:hypothetical protein